LELEMNVHEDDGQMDMDKLYSGKVKMLDIDPSYKLTSDILQIQLDKYLQSIMLARLNFKVETIWITGYEYPTQEEDTCLKVSFEDETRHRFEGTFQDDCSKVFRLVQTWLQGSRDAISGEGNDNWLSEEDPHYSLGARQAGVSYRSANPAYFEHVYWGDIYPEQSVASYPVTNVKYVNGIVHFEKLNDKLELEKSTYGDWLPRLSFAMNHYIKFTKEHDRAYDLKHILKVEGKEQPRAVQMTENMTLTWRAKNTIFEIISDNRFYGKIEKQEDVEFRYRESKGKKEFDQVCMKFNLEVNGQTETFEVSSNCELIYFDILKLPGTVKLIEV